MGWAVVGVFLLRGGVFLTQDHINGELCQQRADGCQLFGVVQSALSAKVA